MHFSWALQEERPSPSLHQTVRQTLLSVSVPGYTSNCLTNTKPRTVLQKLLFVSVPDYTLNCLTNKPIFLSPWLNSKLSDKHSYQSQSLATPPTAQYPPTQPQVRPVASTTLAEGGRDTEREEYIPTTLGYHCC